MEVREISSEELKNFPLISALGEFNHEQIVFCNDNATGLKAIIAVHNTTLGPALGGTRMWMYDNETQAVNDALRLSRGMTYKNAISGLNLGGGKAVIIGDSKTMKNEALFRRFGKFVNSLGGKYITAQDVGISPSDISWISNETEHVVGLPGKSVNPSLITALGVYMGMKASAKMQYGSDSLNGKTIAVQGAGSVGTELIRLASEEGAKIYVSDINKSSLQEVASKYNANVVELDEIYDVDMDIFAPCALGATVNDDTLARLNCSVIAGSANNQLADDTKHGQQILDKGIVYAPDFVINSGGVISVYPEIMGWPREWGVEKTKGIYDTIYQIVKRSAEEKTPSHVIANRMAEERIEAVGKVKLSY